MLRANLPAASAPPSTPYTRCARCLSSSTHSLVRSQSRDRQRCAGIIRVSLAPCASRLVALGHSHSRPAARKGMLPLYGSARHGSGHAGKPRESRALRDRRGHEEGVDEGSGSGKAAARVVLSRCYCPPPRNGDPDALASAFLRLLKLTSWGALKQMGIEPRCYMVSPHLGVSERTRFRQLICYMYLRRATRAARRGFRGRGGGNWAAISASLDLRLPSHRVCCLSHRPSPSPTSPSTKHVAQAEKRTLPQR